MDEQLSSILRSSDDISDDDSSLFPVTSMAQNSQTPNIDPKIDIASTDDALVVDKSSQDFTDPTRNFASNHHDGSNQTTEVSMYRESLGRSQIQNYLDPHSISRLYKRELVTQACCYVASFCCTIFINSAANIKLVLGRQPSLALIFTTTLLYPLGGFFNILVYTRPNVASFLRKCPECSWLEAFWLVLKAGGEIPDEHQWREAYQQRRANCCLLLFARMRKWRHGEDGQNNEIGSGGHRDDTAWVPSPGISQVHGVSSQGETISEFQFGMPSQPPAPDETLPDSNLGINGLSESIDSDNIAHRASEDWSHVEGEGSRMMAIVEEGDVESSSALESSEMLVSEENAVDVLSTLSSSASQREEKRKKEDLDAMWEATFDRVKKYEEGND